MKTQDRTIREKFRNGVIATLLLDQQSGHKPTNEHFANRITLLFDHYVSELKQPEKQEIDKLELPKDMTEIKLNEVIEAVNKLLKDK